MAACRACRVDLEARFRFCPWCSAPQRSKIVEFFRSHPLVEREEGRALRVSRYLGSGYEEQHVRFSVWNDDGIAEAAVSLDEHEAKRLGGFLLGVRAGRRPVRPSERAGRIHRRFRVFSGR